jgi:hypothetical protein
MGANGSFEKGALDKVLEIGETSLSEAISEYRARRFRKYDEEKKTRRAPIYSSPIAVSDTALYEAFYQNLMHSMENSPLCELLNSACIDDALSSFERSLSRKQELNNLPFMPRDYDIRKDLLEMFAVAMVNSSTIKTFKISNLNTVISFYTYLLPQKEVEFTTHAGPKIVHE